MKKEKEGEKNLGDALGVLYNPGSLTQISLSGHLRVAGEPLGR